MLYFFQSRKEERSRSRSADKKAKKKKHKKDRSSSSEGGRRDKLKRKGDKRERDWSHSPIHKSRYKTWVPFAHPQVQVQDFGLIRPSTSLGTRLWSHSPIHKSRY